ncbi:hypothetical protein [Streptomyces sp. NPDC020983]|uniref:hypothetical protein n=1 Tax=Streptomyces sp. NPDC020983 TaxID=3365106 RepID=UPI0037A18620
MTSTQRLILSRSADMMLMEVSWTGCAQAGDRLTVTDAGAVLSVLLPPQSLAEAKVRPGTETAVRAARLAGASRLEVGLGLPVGAEIPLTVEGILAALAGGAVVGGAVEAPFGLVLDPAVEDSLGNGTRLLHQVSVLTEQGVTSVWQLPLAAPHSPPLEPGARGPDPPGVPGATTLTLGAVSLGSDEGAPGPESDGAAPDFRPLNAVDRGQISAGGPVTLEDLRLTALGSSFSATQLRQGDTGQPSFRWDHRASLGRDAKVRVERLGRLWPFGHTAVLLETAERVVDDGVAGLRLTTELRITEPVRSFPDDGSPAARAFPFTSVEVLTRSVTGLADNWQQFARPPSSIQPLIDQRDQLQNTQLADAEARVAATHYPRSADELFASGYPESGDVARLAEIQPTIDQDAQALQDDAQARSEVPVQPPPPPPEFEDPDHPPPDPPPPPEPDPRILSADAFARISAELQQLEAEASQCQARISARLAALAPFVAQEGNVDGLAALGDPDAAAALALRAQIAALQQQIDELSTPLPLLMVPSLPDENGDPQPVNFQVRCTGTLGDVCFAVPLVFVDDLVVSDGGAETYRAFDDPELATRVRDWLSQSNVDLTVELPGNRIDLIRDPAPRTTDVRTVNALHLDGRHENREFRPVLTGFDIEIPELRALLPDLPVSTSAVFSPSFTDGEPTDAAIALEPPISADFGVRAERGGGLIAPTFDADVVSRTFGPADQRALPGTADVLAAFQDMRLLGIPLSSLLPADTSPPEIVQVMADGKPPGVRMSWQDLHLKSSGILVAHQAPHDPPRADTTTVSLTAEITPDGTGTRCEMSPFMLSVPGGSPILELSFSSLVFEQKGAAAPDLTMSGFGVTFCGPLDLLKQLESVVDLGDSTPSLDVTPEGLTASYGLAVPSLPAMGVFSLQDIAVRVGVAIPFRGGSPAVDISFSTREDPFQLTVLSFGGGGYLQLTVDGSGLKRLEASLDFGASIGVDFGIVKAEVHALGGIRYVMQGNDVQLTGFIRLGGSVDILGLASVSIDLLVELTYDSAGNRLIGHASLVVEIDLTLYSDSVQLDSGEWVLAGDGGNAPAVAPGGDAGQSDWKQYQEAYA